MKQFRFGSDFPNSDRFLAQKANPKAKATRQAKDSNPQSILANQLPPRPHPSNDREMETQTKTFNFSPPIRATKSLLP
jgi:hypothetical protein